MKVDSHKVQMYPNTQPVIPSNAPSAIDHSQNGDAKNYSMNDYSFEFINNRNQEVKQSKKMEEEKNDQVRK